MKKLMVAGAVIAAVFVIAALALTVLVKAYLKSDRLKAIIIPEIEEATGRTAQIESIGVSLFKGIDVRGISLMDRGGKGQFIAAKEFILDYELMPLFHRQIVIKQLKLVSPLIVVTKQRDGSYNFSDILEKATQGKREPEQTGAEGKGIPFSVVTDKISVTDGRMTFTDETGGIPSLSAAWDADLRFTAEKGAAPEVAGKVDLKELTLKLAGGEIKNEGTVEIGRDTISLDLTATAGGDRITVSGDVKDYRTAPAARIDITSKELDLERLMALEGESKTDGKAGRHGKVESARRKTTKGGLTATGDVKIAAAKYKDYTLRDFSAHYAYTGDNVTIGPIGAAVSGMGSVKVEGTARGDLKFSLAASDSAAASVKETLTGKATLDLSRCEVERTKITDAIALFTGIREIASPRFDRAGFVFTIADRRINLTGTMSSALMTLEPSGFVGFDKKIDLTTDLRVAPSLAGGLTPAAIAAYVKDDKGWTAIPLRIAGTMDRPSVGLNPKAVRRQVEKAVKQEIEKRLLKGLFGK